MIGFLQTFLISCVPAIITGTVSYLIANKKSVAQINVLKEQNKHDLEKLMEQHKIDIDSLNTKHQQEIVKSIRQSSNKKGGRH